MIAWQLARYVSGTAQLNGAAFCEGSDQYCQMMAVEFPNRFMPLKRSLVGYARSIRAVVIIKVLRNE